jgi:hypothetical protein
MAFLIRTLLLAIAIGTAVIAGPLAEIQRKEASIPGRYIVQLKPGTPISSLPYLKTSNIQYNWDSKRFAGFAGISSST